ncbi:LruC domain-containing protein [bacterium]|nr:LruC domain-containing protein [bacterium]
MNTPTLHRWGAAVITAAVSALFAASCGGGSSTPGPVDLSDNGAPGIVTNDSTGGSISVGLPQAGFAPDQVPGASEDAPLGLNTDYTPVVGGFETTKSSAKASSALQPGDDLAIRAATIAEFGEQPDYEAENPSFIEGEIVTLWVEYEVSGQAPGVEISWFSAETEIDFTAPFIALDGAGVYTTKFTATVPVGSAGQASYDFSLDYGKTVSLVVGPGLEGPDTVNVPFQIVANTPNTEVTFEPPTETPPGDHPACVPHISVVWSNDDTSVTVTSSKNLSNVVLQFEDLTYQKFEKLTGFTGTFKGTGNNAGKRLRGAYVHSGCNTDYWNEINPSWGEYFSHNITGHNLMVWEDLIQNSDYDYNDFVSSMFIREIRDQNGDLIEIDLEIKALARGAGYDHDWQFNIDSAFPGATCVATIDQYYANGNRHGAQRIWNSTQGVSIPVFVSSKQALPAPPGYWATNAFDNQPVVNGDYAIVKIQFDEPMEQGSYTGMPYEPELRVHPSGGNVYVVPLWTKPGDYIDSNGRPLAFIVPNTYAWCAESVKIWTVYPQFNNWANWANGSAPEPNAKFYDYAPVGDIFNQSYTLINSVEFITQ